MPEIASQKGPSPHVVIPHFVFGGVIWLVVTVIITVSPDAFTQHYFNSKLLSITHLLVFGWITMVIFGALHQLIPVILEVKLFSERLALSSFILLAAGALLLAFSFWNFYFGAFMYISATFILVAVALFAINIFITARRSEKESIEKEFILTSIIWLLFTVGAGLTLAVNLSNPFLSIPHFELLKLHAHAGIVGWFLQLIIGVGSRLLPMFMVSHNLNLKKLKIVYYLINTGLIIGLISLYAQWQPGVVACVFAVVVGVVYFLLFIFEAYKKRAKKHLDIGMKQSALSFIILLIPLALILILATNSKRIEPITLQMIIAYGTTVLLGFITALIMGQTYKTLPFIIWLKVYRNQIGKGKTPLPKELYSEKAANLQLGLFIIGFFTLLAGIFTEYKHLISMAGIILFFAVLLYNYNILKIIFHKSIILQSIKQ